MAGGLPSPSASDQRLVPWSAPVDGLRGVAVTAVLLYHLDRGLLPGGFLGVDLFFVLSGFLITSQLLARRAATGRIDLARFWRRRARRLAPAVVVLVAAVLAWDVAVGWTRSVDGEALGALGYVANWQQVLARTSYFDAAARSSPFDHLWSLSVEEQWYLIWPLLLVGLLVVARGRLRRAAVAVAVLALGSAGWMRVVAAGGGDPTRAYVGTDTRAQALLVGAALALAVPLGAGLGRAGRWLAGIVAPVGLASWFVLVVAVDDASRWLYEGGFLVAAAAAGAAVAGCAHGRGPVIRLLGARPLVAVGQRSYGLYLWHWPVIVALDPQRVEVDGWRLAAARLAVTAALAAVSYAAVERPVLEGRVPARRLATGGVVVAVVTGLLLSAGPLERLAGTAARVLPTWTALRDVVTPALAEPAGPGGPSPAPGAGSPAAATGSSVSRVDTPARPEPAGAADGRTAGESTPSGQRIGSESVALRAPNDEAGPTTASEALPTGSFRLLVAGDSVPLGLTQHYDPTVVAAAVPGLSFDLVVTARPGCGLAGGVYLAGDRRLWPWPGCAEMRRTWEQAVADARPDLVLLLPGAMDVLDVEIDGAPLVVGTPAWRSHVAARLVDALDVLGRRGAHLVVGTAPCYAQPPGDPDGLDRLRNDPARPAALNAVIRRFAAEHSDRVHLVDLMGWLCPDGVSPERTDLRDDGVHLNAAGVRVAWAWLAPQLAAAAR